MNKLVFLEFELVSQSMNFVLKNEIQAKIHKIIYIKQIVLPS